MSTYRLEKTELNSKWDKFVLASENGTIFSLSNYLRTLDITIGTYYCLKNREIRGALLVGESKNGRHAIVHDFIIYNGILFGPLAHRQNWAQRLSEQFAIATAIAEQLPQIYRNIKISLHPSIIDIRPFLWVNYGTRGPKYLPDIRYTTYVNISDFAAAKKLEDIALYRNASTSRRQEVRYAISKGVVTTENYDPEMFIDFYYKTMLRQDIQVDPRLLQEMRSLLKGVMRMRLGRMFTSFTAQGEPGSMAFFGLDNKRAYYIFGANDPEKRDTHTGTAVLWNAFHSLSREGIMELDMEGINSPHRGWFKLSFGGTIIPYYQLTFQNKRTR